MVGPEATLREAIALMRDRRRGSVLVCGGGSLEGILTERDVVRLLAAGAATGRPVREVMTPSPETVSRDETMASAMRRMREGGFRRLPVLDGTGRLTGLLKVTGVVRYLVEHVPDAVHNLPPRPEPHTAEREGP